MAKDNIHSQATEMLGVSYREAKNLNYLLAYGRTVDQHVDDDDDDEEDEEDIEDPSEIDEDDEDDDWEDDDDDEEEEESEEDDLSEFE